jgi:hypothetical protein
MGKKANEQILARERARRARVERMLGPAQFSTPVDEGELSETQRRRNAATVCGWCQGPIQIKAAGRIPKWCSPACRQRAWEQARAAASGRAAVQVVERVVHVPVERHSTPRHGDWPGLLRELTAQLDSGRIYPRDLPDLTNALTDLLDAYQRHPYIRSPHR